MEKTVVIMSSPEFNAKNYDQVWDDLRAAGQSHPKGLISHVGFAKPEGGWMVVDVWESPQAFADFSKVLVPIIQKTGVNVPGPKIIPAHNVYELETEKALA